MAAPISRMDNSLIGRWWWTVDRWSLSALGTLLGLGVLLSFAASPSVANHLKIGSFYFVIRHIAFVIPSVFIMIGVSLLPLKSIRRLALLLFFISLALLILTPVMGAEIKGARRWMSLAGFSIQPSELMKPAFAILSAWMFSEKHMNPHFPGNLISGCLYLTVVGLLILQPDLGMTVLISCVWFAQFFFAGLSILWILLGIAAGIIGLFAAYFFLPHVSKRIDQFIDPTVGDRFSDKYQITQSLDAFMNGGLFGQGPGEGVIKKALPDAHADFVFAVAGEEFGLLMCLIISLLFLFIVIRSFLRILHETNLFIILAVAGLMIQFGLQALINIASTINLIPTKGMTLPFLSYGGSSMIAVAIGMGMVLALTRCHAKEIKAW